MLELLYSPKCKVLVSLLQTVQQVSMLQWLGDLYIHFTEFARQVASITLLNLTALFFNYFRSAI